METKSGFRVFRARLFIAFQLCSGGLLLAMFSLSEMVDHRQTDDRERYMPVPGGNRDDLDRMEVEWNNRLTYPTGRFDPAWVRSAAARDALITRGIPIGLQGRDLKGRHMPLALDPDRFTALGPQPLRMTRCSLP